MAVEDHPKHKKWRSASDHYLAAEERFISVRLGKHTDSAFSQAKIARDKALSAYLEIIDELD